MTLEVAKQFVYEGNEYIVICEIEHNNIKYYFINKIESSEPTDEYRIVTNVDNNISIVEDNNLINELMPEVQQELARIIKEEGYDE